MAVNKVRVGRSPPTWLAAIKYASALVGVAAAYYVLAKLGLRLASINPSASPIWPPTGIALAAVLLGGYRIGRRFLPALSPPTPPPPARWRPPP